MSEGMAKKSPASSRRERLVSARSFATAGLIWSASWTCSKRSCGGGAGPIAFDTYLGILRRRGTISSRGAFTFAHDRVHRVAPGSPVLISSYHPSQQNTFTGKLTPAMLRKLFARAARLVART
jgi:hypothetical protein